MIRSMTGFGTADGRVGAARVTVEVRTVNHRFFSPSLKLPTPLARWHYHDEYEIQLILESRGQAFIGDYVGNHAHDLPSADGHSLVVPQRQGIPTLARVARPRSCGGKMATISDRVAGMISAAPMPMTARTATTWAGLSAKAPRAEAAAKTTSPTTKAPLRPKRSPKAPAVSSRPANTMA